ncbi:2-dehydro-3-deoxygalactonokinase, partial [Salmonella enterica]|uniref:2-dehydro-3-deoxygalactonokinase n=1 Tax=Salmonella enterica TaxID=28901 RepID=UPI00398C659E
MDWGSTNLRAWLYQGDKCLESRQSEAGVTRLNGNSPDAVLAEVTPHWRDSATPVVMPAIIRMNVRRQHSPYLPVPAHFPAICSTLTRVCNKRVALPRV